MGLSQSYRNIVFLFVNQFTIPVVFCCFLITYRKGLNPYSNGMRIELFSDMVVMALLSLNPYSNGMRIERR